jgi:hypothetical protein
VEEGRQLQSGAKKLDIRALVTSGPAGFTFFLEYYFCFKLKLK